MGKTICDLHDIVQNNGKTIKQNNMEIKHNIPIGKKVYIESKEYNYSFGFRLFRGIVEIYSHDRDCDGTPLYSVIEKDKSIINHYMNLLNIEKRYAEHIAGVRHGFSEGSLLKLDNDLIIEDISEDYFDELHYKYIEMKNKKGI